MRKGAEKEERVMGPDKRWDVTKLNAGQLAQYLLAFCSATIATGAIGALCHLKRLQERGGAARQGELPQRRKRLRKKSEKQIPRGLKPARKDMNKRLRRWPEGQLYPIKDLFRSL